MRMSPFSSELPFRIWVLIDSRVLISENSFEVRLRMERAFPVGVLPLPSLPWQATHWRFHALGVLSSFFFPLVVAVKAMSRAVR